MSLAGRSSLRGTGAGLLAAGILALTLGGGNARAALIADFVFVIDTSASMVTDLRRLAEVVDTFPLIVEQEGIDGRFAVVAFGTNRFGRGPVEPRLTLSFTSDRDALAAAIGSLSEQITRQTEAGTEAIQFALDRLDFRPEGIANLILVTDEDDDRPASIDGRREPPFNWGASPETAFFQARVDETAQALIAQEVLVNMIINPADRPARFQYGSPTATRVNPDGTLNIDATLLALVEEGFDRSIQGQLLGANILSRAFRIAELRRNPAVFWNDFFRLKAQEVVPEPATWTLLVGGLLGLVALRARGS